MAKMNFKEHIESIEYSFLDGCFQSQVKFISNHKGSFIYFPFSDSLMFKIYSNLF